MTDTAMPARASETDCHPTRNTGTVVVLGIGNLLWADEGFGVRCVEAFQQRHDFEPAVELVDGGTQGLYLIQHVQQASHLLIFDAVDYGLPPGTLKVVDDEEVPRFLGAKKMSLHQTGFQEVLMLAQLTEQYPERVRLIGCQPQQLEDYGGSLTLVVKDAMEQALQLGVQTLVQWGVQVLPRQRPVSAAETVTTDTLAMAAYEAGRPAAELACRIGDDRFLASSGQPEGR